jgi:hypothetical protein
MKHAATPRRRRSLRRRRRCRRPARWPANPPSGPAVIPRYPADTQPAADPPPVYILGPDPYYDGVRPIRRPPPHLRDPGPPPGKRPCQNLAGIQRSNC